jgi:hypothetical protein
MMGIIRYLHGGALRVAAGGRVGWGRGRAAPTHMVRAAGGPPGAKYCSDAHPRSHPQARAGGEEVSEVGGQAPHQPRRAAARSPVAQHKTTAAAMAARVAAGAVAARGRSVQAAAANDASASARGGLQWPTAVPGPVGHVGLAADVTCLACTARGHRPWLPHSPGPAPKCGPQPPLTA